MTKRWRVALASAIGVILAAALFRYGFQWPLPISLITAAGIGVGCAVGVAGTSHPGDI